jgi:hypothetical protein
MDGQRLPGSPMPIQSSSLGEGVWKMGSREKNNGRYVNWEGGQRPFEQQGTTKKHW